jgi:mono/diheme cytochrome c family protein
VILNGLNGEIEINGEIYNNVMASHSFLSDQQISDVLTYVRSSFGNDASEVTAEEVAAVRATNEG